MNQPPDVQARTEIGDGTKITWHQGHRDGRRPAARRRRLRAPIAEGRDPVIMTYGVYARGLADPDQSSR